jgi:hypothetical protein
MRFLHIEIFMMIPSLMRRCLDVRSQSAIRALHGLAIERAGRPAPVASLSL